MSNATAAKIATRVTGFYVRRGFAKTFKELKSYDGFAGAIAIDKELYSTMILILVWFC
jgi:L-asparaginase